MALKYFLSVLLTHNLLMSCASAAVHSHSVDTIERESDGSFRPRNADHYGDAGHNSEFDHEAILGSVREAEEFDRLSPEQAKEKLEKIAIMMDFNKDQHVDRAELKKWIMNNFYKLSLEEAEERMQEADDNRDGAVSWPEYLRDAFGVDAEEDVEPGDTGDSGMLVQEEKAMWAAADRDGDGRLQFDEFAVFTSPEEHEAMHPYLVNQTLREKDANGDGKIDFHEFVGDRGTQQDKAWLMSEKDKFEHDWDQDGDGVLDRAELKAWIIPDNEEIAEEEVSHLFAAADDDHDELLSLGEIVRHHDVFVGSEATDYGADMLGHFDDEL